MRLNSEVYDFHHKAHEAHKERTKTPNQFANLGFNYQATNINRRDAEFAET